MKRGVRQLPLPTQAAQDGRSAQVVPAWPPWRPTFGRLAMGKALHHWTAGKRLSTANLEWALWKSVPLPGGMRRTRIIFVSNLFNGGGHHYEVQTLSALRTMTNPPSFEVSRRISSQKNRWSDEEDPKSARPKKRAPVVQVVSSTGIDLPEVLPSATIQRLPRHASRCFLQETCSLGMVNQSASTPIFCQQQQQEVGGYVGTGW